MTIHQILTDPFGRKARADLAKLAKKYNEATHKLAAQDGCKDALTTVIREQQDALNHASVRLAGGGNQYRAIRAVLTEQLALAVVDALAGKFAMDLADALAAGAGLDVRGDMQSRINEMSGAHTMPRPDLVDGDNARQHPADDGDEPAEDDGTGTAEETQEIEVAT